MQNVKVPGVIWIAVVVIAVALAHRYLPDPFVVELVIVVGTMILKGLNLGTSELNQALDIIDIFKRQPRMVVPLTPSPSFAGEPQMRGPAPTIKTTDGISIRVDKEMTLIQEPPQLPAPPPRPNKVAAWLVG